MTDRRFIYAFDLGGNETTVEISKVIAGELVVEGGAKKRAPVLFFKGKEKGLALNSTNSKTIAALYGNYVERWIGQSVTLYPTTTKMAGETVECIRIKPRKPGKVATPDQEPQ